MLRSHTKLNQYIGDQRHPETADISQHTQKKAFKKQVYVETE